MPVSKLVDNVAGNVSSPGLSDFTGFTATGQHDEWSTVADGTETGYRAEYVDGTAGYETGRGVVSGGILTRAEVKTSTAGAGTKYDFASGTVRVSLVADARRIGKQTIFGLNRDDDGPIVIFAVGQSISLSETPYYNGPYPVNDRMYDYQYISPGVYGFVQGPDLSAPLRADFVSGTAVGMSGGGYGDLYYGMAARFIEEFDRDVYVCKLAIGGASITSLEATHWDNGAYVDSTPGDLYNLLEQHFPNALSLLSSVPGAPAYPDYLFFTQGATNAAKINWFPVEENADYLPPLEWAERAHRLISLWDNPNSLNYISKDDTRIGLIDLPPNRSWDYTGDHMRMLAHLLGERAILISQGERPLDDFIHPTGDGSIDLGDDAARTVIGEMSESSREPGWRIARNKTDLAYTTYLREADGTGDVTEDLRWRYDSTNDLLIISPTDGSTINWGWLDLRERQYYKFEETADSDRSVLFRVTGRHTFDPEDVYQLRIPIEVTTVGSSGWPRVGEALTSSVTDVNGNATHLNNIYSLDGTSVMETDENIRLNQLKLAGSDTFLENLRIIGDAANMTMDVDGNVQRSAVSSQNWGAEVTGLSTLLNPTMGGIGAESGVVKRVGFKVEIYGVRTDSGTTDEVWKARREGIVYFDGTTGGLTPAASDIHANTTEVLVDTGTTAQSIHVEGFIGSIQVRPTGITGQTWVYRSKFEWEIIEA